MNDSIICLDCKHRKESRHNQLCPYCGVMMVYENAAISLGWISSPKPAVSSEPEEGQLALFFGGHDA